MNDKSSMMGKALLAAAIGTSLVAMAENVPLKSSLMFFPGTPAGEYFTGVTYDGCASGDTLIVSSKKMAEFPSALEESVLFQLDASSRTGWEFAAGSETKVVKIPSKIGSRTLTMELGNWNEGNGWGTTADQAMVPPELSYDEDLGATVLDFGVRGSGKALCFDAVGETAYANMSGIGTIITLRGSQQGGGWLLGGGGNGGYGWHRSSSDQYTGESVAEYDSQFGDGNSMQAFQQCDFYADGQRTSSSYFTFSGGWDLFAMQPTAATLTALGLGMGDARSGSWPRGRASGGFKVAEMIVFNRRLEVAEIKDVLAYLKQKWLKTAMPDYNGRTDVEYMRVFKADTAYNLAGLSAGLDVPAGETLAVKDLDGARSRASSANLDNYGLTKTGAGTLALGDASGFGNKIDLREGTLAFPAKPIPTSLGSFKIAEHFDASAAAGTVRADGNGAVVQWNNSSAQRFYGQPMFAGVPEGAVAPTLVRNALGAGLDVVDFGAYKSGMYLSLMTNETAKVNISQRIQTVLAVIDVSKGGGNLLSGVGSRNGSIFVNGVGCFSTGYDARCYVNGVRITPSQGYPYPGWVVVALQGQGGSSRHIAMLPDVGTGGLKIAELVVCRGYLSEKEVLDASAYLANKWLGKALPGYASPKTRVAPDVQRFAASAGTAVRVDAGRTAKVAPIGPVSFTKTGDGTLEVVADGVLKSSVEVKGGTLRYVKPAEPASAETYAAEPALHIDPSRPDTLQLSVADNVKYVSVIADADGGANALYNPQQANANRPILNETDTVNGLPVLDFNTKSRCMAFVKGIDGVRSVFVVFGSQSAGSDLAVGPILGYYTGDDKANRNGNFSNANIPDFQGGEGSNLALGSSYVSPGMVWFTNGVSATYGTLRNGGYELIEAHPVVPAFAGALQRASTWCPGVARYGEILIYDRALTEREKVATRNYLLKKWFPGVPRTALPERPVSQVAMDELKVGGSAELGGEVAVSVKSLVGEGTMTVGDGVDVTLSETSAFTGTVAVASGTLVLTGDFVAGGCPTENRLLHFDATEGVTTTDVGGKASVTAWASKVGGYRAVPFGPAGMATNHLVYLTAEDLPDGCTQPVVDFPDKSCMRIVDAAGNGVQLKGARSLFWVLGSKRGGGWLIAGGDSTSNNYGWMRAKDGGGYNDATTPLFHTAYIADSIKYPTRSHWFVNGSLVNQTETENALSGGWDLVSGHFQDGYNAPGIMGLACDARRFDQSTDGNVYHCGCQTLAELIVYDRLLTDEERRAVESYLAKKWGGRFRGYRSQETNALSVELADGASLHVADGTSQYVAALVGGGQVAGAGALTLGSLNVTVDGGVASKIVSEGTLAFPADIAVSFDGIPTDVATLMGSSYVIATAAGGYVGLENLKATLKKQPLPGGLYARAKVVGNDLVLVFRTGGFFTIVR